MQSKLQETKSEEGGGRLSCIPASPIVTIENIANPGLAAFRIGYIDAARTNGLPITAAERIEAFPKYRGKEERISRLWPEAGRAKQIC